MRPLIILLLFASLHPPAFGANKDTAREILRRMKVRVDVATLFALDGGRREGTSGCGQGSC